MATQGQLSNHTLGNKYLLGELLGYGGFGEVYKAQNILLNRPQAIKVILEKHLSDPKFGQRFQREAQTLAALDHPNIVHIDDFELEQERAYLVMPYISGGTLHSILVKAGPLPLDAVKHYLKQICAALDYAHARNVVHLDLKPHNLLHQNGILLLSDFGLAHLMKQNAVEGGTSLGFGSPLYMAPEQINGQPQARSDIYALGVILYQMLAGRPPFEGPTPEGIIFKQVMEPPPPLSAMRPDVPQALGLVVEKALVKKPEERYATAGALLQAFSAALLPTALPPVRSVNSPNIPKSPSPKNTPNQPGSAVPTPFVPETLSPTVFVVPSKRGIPRRTIVLGMGLTGLALVIGGLSWFETTHWPQPSSLTLTSIPLGKLLFTYRGHSDRVYAVAWSPDGKRIASGSKDKTVQVWDAMRNGYTLLTYTGHMGPVSSVAWSPDGKDIASGSNDQTVQVWDTTDRRNVFTYRGHKDWVETVAWSPDGRRIASGSGSLVGQSDYTVQVWDAADGGNVFTYSGHSDIVNIVAWSPDGKRIASGSKDKTVRVWDAATGDTLVIYRGHSDVVETVAWSPDGRLIASGSGGSPDQMDKTVQVWDATTGGHVFTYGKHTDWVFTVAWSPDGKRIASGSRDTTVQMWDATDGGHVFTYRGHSGAVRAVAWSPDGRRIVSASDDTTVQVWVAG